MPERQLQALMWAQACEAMERAERLHRQFFHRGHGTPNWEAPCDIFETDDTLTILIALPGVAVDQIQVTLSAGVLVVTGERPLPPEMAKGTDSPFRDSARPFSTADRIAAGTVRAFRPSSREWMSEGAAAQIVNVRTRLDRDFSRIFGMPVEQQQELRTAEAGAPPPSGAMEQLLAGIPPLPSDALILIPTRSFVLFPGTVLPVTLGRQRSIAAAQAAIRLNRPIGLRAAARSGNRGPDPGRSAPDGHRGQCTALCHEPRWAAPCDQPG